MPRKQKEVLAPTVEPTHKTHTARITDHWLPFPEALLIELGWKEGDHLEIVPIYGNQLVVRPVGALKINSSIGGTDGSSGGSTA